MREPKLHRAATVACPTDRPASSPPPNPGTCTTDAECTNGKNGRCTSVALAPSTCTYDECTTDKECGSGVCQCRDPAAGGANACRNGSCRTDGDCGVVGRGYCSPSAVNVDVYCRSGIPAGSFGWFCHGTADECTDDADCADGAFGNACIYDVAKQHWACRSLLCTD